MLISDEHRFIFVHVPKCAGRSIRAALQPHSRHAREFWLNRVVARFGGRSNVIAPANHRWLRQHTTFRRAQHYLPQPMLESYFKFSFVRNPWDWLVSYYHFVASKPDHRRYRQFMSYGSFDNYVRAECARPTFLQKDFLTDKHGSVAVDFVGRFESLEEDFAHVCRRVGVSAALGQRNRSVHRDYREYYDRDLKVVVADGFREDIELFGYTFDGLSQRAVA